MTVAVLCGHGMTDKEIADRLHRSYHTVRAQRRAIYAKLGISKDVELFAWVVCFYLDVPFDLHRLREYGIKSFIEQYGVRHRERAACLHNADDEW